jgi:hypothetical protein
VPAFCKDAARARYWNGKTEHHLYHENEARVCCVSVDQYTQGHQLVHSEARNKNLHNKMTHVEGKQYVALQKFRACRVQHPAKVTGKGSYMCFINAVHAGRHG